MQFLIPENCDYITLDVRRFCRCDLEVGKYLNDSRRPSVIRRPHKREERDQRERMRCDDESREIFEDAMLPI